ncbi:MAG: hypothetical protein C0617_07680 [Desulfuromonas sp.]|uniref:tetratricopeptide repeat protein n=1 Tax=Desulfuromonas sp. TaxID=892 RepID=UPI000CC2C804|nr:tetratricopeptide repeat protein [Desulfuromonas sp.]PLX84504.1 MAG: hypothetical protein C0617_07680 [Desulfuromonas sp.]
MELAEFAGAETHASREFIMLRQWIITGLLLVTTLAPAAGAADEIVLRGISKEESPRATTLGLDLSVLPRYEVETSGQRVDLFLFGASALPDLASLPEDGQVIKILLGQQPGRVMVSFLFRRVPKRVEVVTTEKPPRFELEIAWGEGGSRPALAIGRGGRPAILPGDGAMKFMASSEAMDWKGFFASFETPLEYGIAPRFSLPALPEISYHPLHDDRWGQSLASAVDASNRGAWQEVRGLLQAVPEDALMGADREVCLALLGEALVRTGAPEPPRALEELRRDFPASALLERAAYLDAVAIARCGDTYAASCALESFGEAGGRGGFYCAHAALLQAEISLAQGRPEEARPWLETPRPESLNELFRLRRADLLYAAGSWSEALEIYRGLEGADRLWGDHPSSRAGFAEALFLEGAYDQAEAVFRGLACEPGLENSRGLLLFASARCALRAGQERRALTEFAALRNDHPDSEGGLRSWLTILDLRMAAGDDLGALWASRQYGSLAEKIPGRRLQEEAAFKAALATCLEGDRVAGLELLNSFRRRFGSGALQQEANALLAETLPAAVEELLERGEDLKALALVEKNRSHLVHSSFSPDFFLALGESFARVGLLEKAANLYRQLLDGSDSIPGEERFYLPLAQVLFEINDFTRAARYAARYLERFAGGEQDRALRLLQGRALLALDRPEEAARALLGGELSPSREALLLAGQIFFEDQDFASVEECLSRIGSGGGDDGPGPLYRYWRGEALFQLGRGEQALAHFERLAESGLLADQARYRSAQIHLAAGRVEEGLNILRRLAEEGKSPRWQSMAGERLRLAELGSPSAGLADNP